MKSKLSVPSLEGALVQYARKSKPRVEDVIVKENGKKVVKTVKRSAPPVGVFVASKDDNGRIKIGWSKCNKKDIFDRQTGLTIAVNRMAVNRHDNLPHTMIDQFEAFIRRCEEYYKVPIPI